MYGKKNLEMLQILHSKKTRDSNKSLAQERLEACEKRFKEAQDNIDFFEKMSQKYPWMTKEYKGRPDPQAREFVDDISREKFYAEEEADRRKYVEDFISFKEKRE